MAGGMGYFPHGAANGCLLWLEMRFKLNPKITRLLVGTVGETLKP